METTTSARHYKMFGKQGPGPWDVIVVGSGMGGMACAAALAKFGKRVLVLEQHYVPGGFTHTFSRKGFKWDVGVHCVGEMGEKDIPGRLMNWLSDGGIRWEPMGKTYETFFFPDNFKIEFPDSWQGFKDRLVKAFPLEEKAITAYFDLIWRVTNGAKPFFALKAMPRWVDKLGSNFFRGGQWWTKTTAEVLAALTTNEKLKSVLAAQWGYYGSTPSKSSFAIHAMTVRHFWNGGYFPVDGAQTLADHLLKTVADAGGETLVRAPVEHIIIEKGRAVGVRMDGGVEFRAPKIVSAAGALATVQRLLPPEERRSRWAKDIGALKQSPPHICLYLGFEGDSVKAGATRSNQWFCETWNNEIAEWDVRDPKSVAPILYMSFPSLKDPKHEPGPQNRQTGEVVTFVPWDAFAKWHGSRRGNRDPEYLAFKKDIQERLLAQLQKHVPELMKLVTYCELSTPLSTTFFTRAPQGAIYGLEATPKRFTSRSLRTRTPISNLYLAGGDVATLGVTGALVGGVLAAGTIQPRVLLKLI